MGLKGDNMDIKDIRDVFEERSEQGYMDRQGQIPIDGLYHGKIVDVLVTMKSGNIITIFCGEENVTLDATNTHPNRDIGIGNTLIEPMKDIVDIKISWR